MEEKKLTDEEVIEALACCGSKEDCLSCPYHKKNMLCYYTRCSDTLDLIHRLQAENEELREKLIDEQFAVDKWMEENAEQKAEIERLTEENEYLDMVAKQALTDYQNTQVQVDELTDKLGKVLSGIKADELLIAKGIEQAVKDTAEEIYQELEDKGYFEYGQFTISGNDLIEIFKNRGVEVE